MSRRKKEDSAERIAFSIGEQTKFWIFSIVAFLMAFFLILAAFQKAGLLGERIHSLLQLLFGFGYFLFPLVFFLLGVVFLRNKRPLLVLTSIVGNILLFSSGLGLIDLLRSDGGIVGGLIGRTLVSLFDFYASLAVLSAVCLISLLIIFDTVPSFGFIATVIRFFKKKSSLTPKEEAYLEEKTNEAEQLQENEETSLKSEDKDSEELQEKGPVIQKTSLGSIFSGSKKQKQALVQAHELSFGGPLTYVPPPLELLSGDKGKPGYGDIKANSNIIKRTLQNFGIDVEMDEVSIGPSVTRYALKPAQGVKLARIVGLQNDLSLALAAHPLRIEAPIPGKSLVGIEIPNSTRTTVGLSSLLSTEEFASSVLPLFISIGRGITGKPYFGNLGKMPHLLIAGSTGSGKSVSIHTIITSLVYRNSPGHLRFIMIDPKRVELTLYNAVPHLLTPVITEAKKAILALKWAAKEMERRYDILETESVRDIESYHKNVVIPAYANQKQKMAEEKEEALGLPERMPYIVIVIDELADMMTAYPREMEAAIIRLAQMSRAVGIHLILSTQRPSVNVITGLIKANIPSRMAFQVTSQTDSRTILDMGGAEKLLGAGDMLYMTGEMSKPVRLQSAFITEGEIKKVADYLRKEYGQSHFDIAITNSGDTHQSMFEIAEDDEETEDDDELFEEARETIMKTQKASTTFLQRRLRIGYARAARLMDMLEERGVVGPADGARPREVMGKNEGYGEDSMDGANGER